jgi:nucleotide-binding universal stress UspA family protein
MPKLSKILVPVDFSPSSKAALEYAVFLSEKTGAEIQVLHAWEVPAYLRPDLTVWSGEVSATLADHAKQEAEKAMHAFLSDSKLEGRKGLEYEIVYGAPYATILSAIESGGYDLVAMGTHGRSGLSHLVLGSVAEKIVRHAKCPVLTIRAHKD